MRLFHSIARLISFIAVLSLQACATTDTYSAKPITATVVDSETGEPLQGVNVVARWRLEEKRSGMGVGDLDLMETVTDKDGTFHFPRWQGKAPPTGKEPLTDKIFVRYETRLSSGSPEIMFFKSAYKPTTLGNEVYLSPTLSDRYHTWERSSEWDGKVIKLEKSKENLEVYGSMVAGITTGFGNGIECPWKKIPRVYVSLMKEKERLDNLGIRNDLPSMATMQYYFDIQKCGSAKDFFEST
jgi:5-hydroxyisourate hydrolase-like protein (transthyretin family)